jgi:hypothetical protein
LNVEIEFWYGVLLWFIYLACVRGHRNVAETCCVLDNWYLKCFRRELRLHLRLVIVEIQVLIKTETSSDCIVHLVLVGILHWLEWHETSELLLRRGASIVALLEAWFLESCKSCRLSLAVERLTKRLWVLGLSTKGVLVSRSQRIILLAKGSVEPCEPLVT